MKILLEYPDEFDEEILKVAREDGHNNRSAVLRKALGDFLQRKSQTVADPAMKCAEIIAERQLQPK